MPEALVYVANWNYKTQETSWRGKTTSLHGVKSVEERLLQLSEAVRVAWVKLDELARQHPLPPGVGGEIVNRDRPLFVFSAPEWLFRKTTDWVGVSDDDEDWLERFYHKADRDAYCRAMEGLSKPTGQADVLMVAGTFHWVGQNSNPQVAELVAARVKKYEDKLQGKWKAKAPPETAKVTEKLNALKTPAKPIYGFNEALVYFNGGLRKTVSKSSDAGDFRNPAISFMPGLGAGTFSLAVGGHQMKVGVSICVDATRIAEYQKDVDLLLLVSNTVSPKVVTKGTVRPGGLMVYSDGIESNQIIPGPALEKDAIDKMKEGVRNSSEAGDANSIQVGCALVTVGVR
jgi:hypothetical protein